MMASDEAMNTVEGITELRSVANPDKLDWIRPHLTPPSAETG